ncbi:MAG: protocatechuate 3,4-dioxygenase [Betaproteobacteria bacterium]
MTTPSSRRQLFIVAAGSLAAVVAPAWALEKTPAMTEGPFYPRPVDMPLDDDNDLTRIKGKDGVASGTLIDLAGTLVDSLGRPVSSATVEIWQCNSHGKYHDGRDDSSAPLDPFFQGFGKARTDEQGQFRFRTIRPVAYPGRAPHIHFKVKGRAFRELTSQLFFAGDAGLERDGIFRSLRTPELKKQMTVELGAAAANSGVSLTGHVEIKLA